MNIYLNLQVYQSRILFQEVKNTKDFLTVKLKLLEYLLTFWYGNEDVHPPFLYINTERPQRVFLVNSNENKIVSFGFEFLVKTENYDTSLPTNYIKFINYRGKQGIITLQTVSEAQTLLQLYSERSDNLYCFTVLENDEKLSEESERLFEHILFSEAGYIRYDYDPKGYKPNTHPLHHFDVNFSEVVHYKLGLQKRMKMEDVSDILNLEKACAQLHWQSQVGIQRNIRGKNSKKERNIQKSENELQFRE